MPTTSPPTRRLIALLARLTKSTLFIYIGLFTLSLILFLTSIDKRRKFSRKRANEDTGDITYINEKNRIFNKKVLFPFQRRLLWSSLISAPRLHVTSTSIRRRYVPASSAGLRYESWFVQFCLLVIMYTLSRQTVQILQRNFPLPIYILPSQPLYASLSEWCSNLSRRIRSRRRFRIGTGRTQGAPMLPKVPIQHVTAFSIHFACACDPLSSSVETGPYSDPCTRLCQIHVNKRGPNHQSVGA
jgi:hypothetical protein